MERSVNISITIRPIDDTNQHGSRESAIDVINQAIVSEIKKAIALDERPITFTITSVEPLTANDAH